MDEITTRHLEERLRSVDSEKKLQQYLDSPESVSPWHSAGEYLSSLPEVQKLGPSGLYKLAGVDRSLCYHILSGEKARPGRDLILRLCIAAGLDAAETKRALEAGGTAPLYARNRRDVIISFAMQQKCSVMETNELLDQMGEKPL